MTSFEGGFPPWDRLTEGLKAKGRLEQLALVTADAGKALGDAVLDVAVRRALRAAGSSMHSCDIEIVDQ